MGDGTRAAARREKYPGRGVGAGRAGTFLVIGAVLVAGLSGGAARAGGVDADPEAGRDLAERLCSRCHATGPEGESPLAAAPPFRGFARNWPIDHLAESLAEGIVTGHPDMPQFELAPREIDDLLAWLRTVQTD
ncbi:MAG: cytochrome c [Rhodospirillaceae bacterium]